jgi:hypothetical protein
MIRPQPTELAEALTDEHYIEGERVARIIDSRLNASAAAEHNIKT